MELKEFIEHFAEQFEDTAAEDFKIPLDKNSIGYIFDRGFNDLTDEYKAFIQDIFS